MSATPPPFYTDRASALVALEPDDAEFTGPDRLVRELAECILTEDDVRVTSVLRRAWRSGAPDEVIGSALYDFVVAVGISDEEAMTIANASRLIPLGDEPAEKALQLMDVIQDEVMGQVTGALVAVQETNEPCMCPACIAKLAELN